MGKSKTNAIKRISTSRLRSIDLDAGVITLAPRVVGHARQVQNLSRKSCVDPSNMRKNLQILSPQISHERTCHPFSY